MRIQLLALGMLMLCVSCTSGTTEPSAPVVENATSAPEPDYNFDWLLGSWSQVDGAPDSQTDEYWHKNSEDEYIGLGCTIEQGDTVFKENIRMVRMEEAWVFEVTGVNEAPTLFSVTQRSGNSFVAENPENEFPKRIAYRLEGEELKAVISDEVNKVPFTFRRMDAR